MHNYTTTYLIGTALDKLRHSEFQEDSPKDSNSFHMKLCFFHWCNVQKSPLKWLWLAFPQAWTSQFVSIEETPESSRYYNPEVIHRDFWNKFESQSLMFFWEMNPPKVEYQDFIVPHFHRLRSWTTSLLHLLKTCPWSIQSWSEWKPLNVLYFQKMTLKNSCVVLRKEFIYDENWFQEKYSS